MQIILYIYNIVFHSYNLGSEACESLTFLIYAHISATYKKSQTFVVYELFLLSLQY